MASNQRNKNLPPHFVPKKGYPGKENMVDGLSERQKKFCEFYIETGSASKASELAGYAFNDEGGRLLHHPHIMEYLEKCIRRRIISMVPVSLSSLENIITNGKNESARVQAVKLILDRSGFASRDTMLEKQKNSETPMASLEDLKAVLNAAAAELNRRTAPIIDLEPENEKPE